MELLVLAVLVGLIWAAVMQSQKRSISNRSVAFEAIHHISMFLREATNTGPCYEMDDFYRLHCVDVKCTNCEIDTIFVCNVNASRESEYIDVHFEGQALRIMYGKRVLFNGNPLNLTAYPREAYALHKDNPPPKESGAYAPWKDWAREQSAHEALGKAELPDLSDIGGLYD